MGLLGDVIKTVGDVAQGAGQVLHDVGDVAKTGIKDVGSIVSNALDKHPSTSSTSGNAPPHTSLPPTSHSTAPSNPSSPAGSSPTGSIPPSPSQSQPIPPGSPQNPSDSGLPSSSSQNPPAPSGPADPDTFPTSGNPPGDIFASHNGGSGSLGPSTVPTDSLPETDPLSPRPSSSSTQPLIGNSSPTDSQQPTGAASGHARTQLPAGAIAAISITAFVIVAVALLCCWRAFWIRRRRATRGATEHSWARRPVFSYARRTTVDSTIGFTIPRPSSDAESFEYISRPGSSNAGHVASWINSSATQQRRADMRPPSDSGESYGTPLPPDRRSVTPLPSTPTTPTSPEMAYAPQIATVPIWTYHPNAPLSPISSQGHQALSVESPVTSEWHSRPLHSRISLEAVGVPASPTRDGAVSPFVTRIIHPDGMQELGEDLDAPEHPSSPRMQHVDVAPSVLPPVSPLFVTSFADPFASPQDGAARV